MDKSAIIFFHSGNAVQRNCAGIEIVPGLVKLMDASGECIEYYNSAFIKAFCYDGREFPVLPERARRKGER